MGCCLKLESLESEAGMGSPMQVLTGRPCKGSEGSKTGHGRSKARIWAKLHAGLSPIPEKVLGQDSLTELSHFEAKE